MTLHLIKHSPFDSNALEQCLDVLAPNDGILLLENGAYGVIWQSKTMLKLSQSHELYVLKSDAITRGLCDIPECFNEVDYEGFVDLTLKFKSSISW